jgi:type I site-specific restriction endonuclease
VTPSGGQKEAFSRVAIDAQLKDVGWDLTDGHSVRYEYQLPDGTLADYVLCDRHGRAAAVIEAKRASANLQEAAARGLRQDRCANSLAWQQAPAPCLRLRRRRGVKSKN